MEFKKNLARRFLRGCRIANPSLRDCRISTSRVAVKTRIPPGPERISHDAALDDGVFRRFMHRPPASYGSVGLPAAAASFPAGEKLLEKLRGRDVSRDRIRLEGLIPPPVKRPETEPECNMTAVQARKLLRLSQLERVKMTLRGIEKNHISYSEFIGICGDGCSDSDQGREFAKTLDDSGAVIVLGNVVFLKPQQVIRAIEGLIPRPKAQPDESRMKELEDMETQMAAIEKRAESMARRELWVGLGYLVAQTAVLMRLTFWELTWDVMEPICFYITSIYAMAAYGFFLRTSKEPSFEGFFQTRVDAKKRGLIRVHSFDVERYNQLKKSCNPYSLMSVSENPMSSAS
ncbi:PREDICTED: calcium uniporter protein 2, mitochondrial [Ipomoea nil]|uniref:calcium uniporter protein 2, mitochondrial n=1 Tax=Ipomoea nil TaxID=35883 RepID=UPI00090090FE|nr:PREDICTED: calcium uniporter protein 2, mitochondrial [Ipomoea nil]